MIVLAAAMNRIAFKPETFAEKRRHEIHIDLVPDDGACRSWLSASPGLTDTNGGNSVVSAVDFAFA